MYKNINSKKYIYICYLKPGSYPAYNVVGQFDQYKSCWKYWILMFAGKKKQKTTVIIVNTVNNVIAC